MIGFFSSIFLYFSWAVYAESPDKAETENILSAAKEVLVG
jgi:hypothetical protein